MPKTVLLADDSATIRKVVELTFSDTDIRVVAVSDGRQALERLEQLDPDLVLADVVMPEPSGYEICSRVKASRRPVPVLLLAGTFEPFDEQRAVDCGADGQLVKPFDSRELLERVQLLLSGRPAPVERSAELQETSPRETLRAPEPAAEPPPQDVAESPLAPEALEQLARLVIQRLSDKVVREIAREVVPQIAERIVRERIRELEQEQG